MSKVLSSVLSRTNVHLKNNFIQYNSIGDINYRIDDKCTMYIACSIFNLVLSLLDKKTSVNSNEIDIVLQL